MRRYQVYRGDRLVVDSDSPWHVLRRISGQRGAYLVTDGRGPRVERSPSARHTTGGVIDNPECARIFAHLGPRIVGSLVHYTTTSTTCRVLSVDLGTYSRLGWQVSLWSVRELDTASAEQAHCTPWDPAEHRLVEPESVTR